MQKYSAPQYILLTYRSNIKKLTPSTYYDSDAGWGCMLRVAQMCIANILYKIEKMPFLDTIQLFTDSIPAPFNIQRLTQKAVQFDKKPREWFTPCQAGYLIKELIDEAIFEYRVSVCKDNTLFKDQILHDRLKCVVMIMCRIGMDEPQKIYIKTVFRLTKIKYFVGILGGKPKNAFYFVGSTADSNGLFYLDPHQTNKAATSVQQLINKKEEYFGNPNSIDIKRLDPSFCICFSFESKQLELFWNQMLILKKQLKDSFFIYMQQNTPQLNNELDFIQL